MTIDEAIEKFKFIANSDTPCPRYCMLPCDKCVDESKQLAKWLEDLKDYRENSNSYNKEDIELNRNAMYNKAIDDFVKSIVDRGLSSNDDKYCITRYDNYLKAIKEIAEQLKEGGNIELPEHSKSQGNRTGKQKATIEEILTTPLRGKRNVKC